MAGPSIKRRKDGPSPGEIWALEACLLAVLDDAEDLFGWNLSPEKETVGRRVHAEGIGFLALRLPEFFSWILDSIRLEKLQLPLPRFKCGKDKTKPAFMRKFVDQLFAPDGTYIWSEENAVREMQGEVFRFINVLCNSFGKKYELPLSEDRADEQVTGMFAFDKDQCLDVAANFTNLSEDSRNILLRARSILHSVFSDKETPGVEQGIHTLIHRAFHEVEPKFKFGPGAVYEGYNACDKYIRFKAPPLTAVKALGLSGIFTPSPATMDAENILLAGDFTVPEAKAFHYSMSGGVGRIAIVPKEYDKGRIITIMYNELMYIQQGWKTVLYEWVERHPETRGQVNFTDQGFNQREALTGSRSGKTSTIDLKSASDSVSAGHVSVCFDERMSNLLLLLRPHRLEALMNDGSVLCSDDVRMYAPMGSALCFPVEALVFWSCVKATLELAGCWDTVLVYGDDIIIPTDFYDIVITALSELGFVVNRSKSFGTGPFRESCGVFALNGVDVSTPFRIKKRIPDLGIHKTPSERNAALVAWVKYANLAEAAGFQHLAETVRKITKATYPKARSFPHTTVVEETTEGYLSFLDYSCGKTVRTKEREVVSGADISNKKDVFVGKPSSVYESGLMGPHLEHDEEWVNPLEGLGTYRVGTWAGSSLQAQWKTLYTSEVRRFTPDRFTEPLAYLRWVLEHSEDSRSFDRDEFRIVRRRVCLT